MLERGVSVVGGTTSTRSRGRSRLVQPVMGCGNGLPRSRGFGLWSLQHWIRYCVRITVRITYNPQSNSLSCGTTLTLTLSVVCKMQKTLFPALQVTRRLLHSIPISLPCQQKPNLNSQPVLGPPALIGGLESLERGVVGQTWDDSSVAATNWIVLAPKISPERQATLNCPATSLINGRALIGLWGKAGLDMDRALGCGLFWEADPGLLTRSQGGCEEGRRASRPRGELDWEMVVLK